MRSKTPEWEEIAPGIKVLRLYQTKLNPGWPRILLLDLKADRFREFEHDPLAFDKQYKLFSPEHPIKWVSHCAKLPHVMGIPPTPDSVSWIVMMSKAPGCGA